MPRLIDTYTRTGLLVTAINELLGEGGAQALSLRAIARRVRLSPSSLIHHYESVERLVRIAAFWTGKQRRSLISDRSRAEGVLAFLPADADGVVEARVWLAWRELGRSDEALEMAIRLAVDEERHLAAMVSDHTLAADDLDLLLATIDGLTAAICHPIRPMPWERARHLLGRAYPALTSPGASQEQAA